MTLQTTHLDPQYSTAFKNYSEGEPTTRLYIKNLERKVIKESDLRNIFGRFVLGSKDDPEKDLDINLLLSGRMRGQAFVTFKDQETAIKALEGAHRYILHGKPMIIQFAKSQVAQRQ
jgi:U11/U12 small nuclear ribonucleoprotein 65 kDa protein